MCHLTSSSSKLSMDLALNFTRVFSTHHERVILSLFLCPISWREFLGQERCVWYPQTPWGRKRVCVGAGSWRSSLSGHIYPYFENRIQSRLGQASWWPTSLIELCHLSDNSLLNCLLKSHWKKSTEISSPVGQGNLRHSKLTMSSLGGDKYNWHLVIEVLFYRAMKACG